MNQLPVVIGINGPNGIGKTWLAYQLLKLLPFAGTRIMCPREAIWSEVQSEYGWQGTYEEFKAHVFHDGTNGRDAMIERAEYRRSQDRHYWIKAMVESPLFTQASIIIDDSIAFPEEHDELLRLIPDFITVVIAPSQYSIGMFYDDNYRRCISPIGGFRAIDSNTALESFKKKLQENAASSASNDSAWWRVRLGQSLDGHESRCGIRREFRGPEEVQLVDTEYRVS